MNLKEYVRCCEALQKYSAWLYRENALSFHWKRKRQVSRITELRWWIHHGRILRRQTVKTLFDKLDSAGKTLQKLTKFLVGGTFERKPGISPFFTKSYLNFVLLKRERFF